MDASTNGQGIPPFAAVPEEGGGFAPSESKYLDDPSRRMLHVCGNVLCVSNCAASAIRKAAVTLACTADEALGCWSTKPARQDRFYRHLAGQVGPLTDITFAEDFWHARDLQCLPDQHKIPPEGLAGEEEARARTSGGQDEEGSMPAIGFCRTLAGVVWFAAPRVLPNTRTAPSTHDAGLKSAANFLISATTWGASSRTRSAKSRYGRTMSGASP